MAKKKKQGKETQELLVQETVAPRAGDVTGGVATTKTESIPAVKKESVPKAQVNDVTTSTVVESDAEKSGNSLKEKTVKETPYEVDAVEEYELENPVVATQDVSDAYDAQDNTKNVQTNGTSLSSAEDAAMAGQAEQVLAAAAQSAALTAAEKASTSVSSKADAESALSDYAYAQSDAVRDAYAALEEYQSSAPESYTSSYQEQIDALLEQILNREDFSYDFNADPLYQQYKNQYEHSAQLAMQDTMAQMQSMTGGYGSSYATQAASGAYQSHINELMGKMPELYQLAYSLYHDKGEGMRDNLSALTEQEALAQALYQDLVGNYYTGLEAATEKAEHAYEKDYQQYEDGRDYLEELLSYYAGQEQQAFENEQAQLEYELAIKEYEESVRQFEAELAAKQNQWWAEFEAEQNSGKTSSGGSGASTAGVSSSGNSISSSAGVTLSEKASELKTTITQEMRVYAADGANSSEISQAVDSLLTSYRRTGVITKDEANFIGAAYGVRY